MSSALWWRKVEATQFLSCFFFFKFGLHQSNPLLSDLISSEMPPACVLFSISTDVCCLGVCSLTDPDCLQSDVWSWTFSLLTGVQPHVSAVIDITDSAYQSDYLIDSWSVFLCGKSRTPQHQCKRLIVSEHSVEDSGVQKLRSAQHAMFTVCDRCVGHRAFLHFKPMLCRHCCPPQLKWSFYMYGCTVVVVFLWTVSFSLRLASPRLVLFMIRLYCDVITFSNKNCVCILPHTLW